MSNSSYKPKSDINEYLVSNFNLRIFKVLINTKPFSQSHFNNYKLLNELDFFNTLYEQYDFVKKGELIPTNLIEHLEKTELNPIQNGVLLYFLGELLKNEINHKSSEPSTQNEIYYKLNLYRDIIEQELRSKMSSLFTKRFNIQIIEHHINTLFSTNDKINYILDIQKDFNIIMSYKDIRVYYESEIPIDFNEQCKILLDHIKNTQELQSENFFEGKASSQFKIVDRKGAKINLIRLFNSLYELQLIEDNKGFYPSKDHFMKSIGIFLGDDFSDYHKALNQTYKSSLETNTEIFEALKQVYIDKWSNKFK